MYEIVSFTCDRSESHVLYNALSAPKLFAATNTLRTGYTKPKRVAVLMNRCLMPSKCREASEHERTHIALKLAVNCRKRGDGIW